MGAPIHAEDRRQAFVKELEEIAFMQQGVLPPPKDGGKEQQKLVLRREDLGDRLLSPFQSLANLDHLLEHVIDAQRKTFASTGSPNACPADDDDEIDPDAPPDPDADRDVGRTNAEDGTAQAKFAPSDAWRQPSDYIAYMAKRFEDEWTNPRSGKKEPRPLKRDQVFFVAQFAEACNTIWQQERSVEDNELDISKITCFNILLMGQGGSGKTAVVQDIVLPTLDFLFGCDATLIVCAKWSQAENISTDSHKANHG